MESQFTLQELKNSALQFSGFQFCKMLDNSYFGRRSTFNQNQGNDQYLSYLGSFHLKDTNVRRIDDIAIIISKYLKQDNVSFPFQNGRGNTSIFPVDPVQLQRLSCFLAAYGDNEWYRYAVEKLENSSPRRKFRKEKYYRDSNLQLIFVDGKNYFPDLDYPSIKDVASGEAFKAVIKRDSELPRFKYAIAFSCFKDIELTKRTLSRYHQDGISITMVHVDAKSNITYFNALQEFVKENGWKDVHFSKRFIVHWGHHSIVHAQQHLIGKLLNKANWDHLLLVGADSYPLYNPENMAEKLNDLGEKTFIGTNYKSQAWDNWKWDTKPWIKSANNTHGTLNGDFILRNLFNDYELVSGLQWLTFSRKFLNSMFTSPHAIALHSRMEWIFAPEEFLYHTWGMRCVPNHVVREQKIFYDWPSWSQSSPIVLGEEHFEQLQNAKLEGKLYMRKVSMKNPFIMYTVDSDQFPNEVVDTEAKKYGSLDLFEEKLKLNKLNNLWDSYKTCYKSVLGSVITMSLFLVI